MKTLRLLMIISLLAIMAIPATAMADTLSEERYGFAILGARDYDGYSDPAVSIKLGANLPIMENLDITPFFMYETVDGDNSLFGLGQAGFDSYTLAARGDYFITEKKNFKVYAGGGAGVTHTKAEACITLPFFGTTCSDESSNDLYFQAHGGLDMDLNDKMGLRPECAYIRIGSDDDVSCGARFNIKLGGSFSLLAEAKMFLDNTDLFYSIGSAMTF